MSDLPEPLVAADVDLGKLDGFMLDTVRLLGSELVALSTGDEFKAAVLLWCRAWKQRPACSLPNDDRVLASFAQVPAAKWRKVRDMALRGFVLCSDGRLYHRVLAADAIRAHAAAEQRRKAIQSRWSKRGDGNGGNTEPPMKPPTGPIRPYYGGDTKDGTGRDEKKETSPRRDGSLGPGATGAEPISQAVAVIGAFDRIRAAVFGANRARPWPHPKDRVVAERWLEAGADLALCEGVFEARFRKQAASGEEPSDSLSHMDRSVAGAIAAKASPMPAAPAAKPPAAPYRGIAIGSPEDLAQRRAMGLEP